MPSHKAKLLPVIPGIDYMEVVGRATQEAKAETRYPVQRVRLEGGTFILLDSGMRQNDAIN